MACSRTRRGSGLRRPATAPATASSTSGSRTPARRRRRRWRTTSPSRSCRWQTRSLPRSRSRQPRPCGRQTAEHCRLLVAQARRSRSCSSVELVDMGGSQDLKERHLPDPQLGPASALYDSLVASDLYARDECVRTGLPWVNTVRMKQIESSHGCSDSSARYTPPPSPQAPPAHAVHSSKAGWRTPSAQFVCLRGDTRAGYGR